MAAEGAPVCWQGEAAAFGMRLKAGAAAVSGRITEGHICPLMDVM